MTTTTTASSVLLRRSMLFRTASSASCRSTKSKRSSCFLPCQPLPNSCHQFFSSSPDYHATHDTSSWQQNGAAHQPYFNNIEASNDSTHAVIKNLAGQEFARLDNNSHHHHGSVNLNYNSNHNSNSPLEGPRTSVLMELTDRVGALHDVLKY